ncbi:MAG: hypothetical protein JNL60_04265, partial [Bacteroidia bacterium]|nr:hypothetical protein [Bacteroidia bacterium]
MKTNLNLNQRGKSFFTSVCLFFLLLFATTLRSQNVSVSGAVTGNGTYADLSSAFAAINGGAQTSANISVSILASTSETAIAVLNAGAWTTMTISPSGGSYTISGSIADALVNLNGADNVRIDGLNTGGNALTLVNTNTATSGVSTIRFIGDASSNQVVNCTVLGAGTSASFGTITFSTGATGGNSNNTIQNCNIGSDGANYPAVAIYAAGTSTALNENNNIQSCNIYDFFNASVVSAGVLVGANNSGWTITGNRFYQTGARIFTTANTHRGIQVASGNNYLISNNTIGYSSSSGTGTLVMGGAVANRYNAIEVAAATATASSILNNTITAITLTTSSSAATANGVLCGVIVTSGNANIANNIIGGTSGTDLLFASPTTAQGMIVGINSSSTGTISIQNNYIGGCTSTGTAAALSGGINGINISGAAGLLSITNNTIGNQTVDNMRAGTNLFTTGNSLCVGINFASASTGVVQVSGNIIRNFASYGTGTGGTMRGIYTTGTSGSTTYSIVNNTISNLVSNNSNVAVGNGQLGTGGIIITYGSLNKILNNLISNIALTGTATTAVCMAGISTAVSTDPLISSNRIYDLSNAGTGTTTTGPPMVFGVFIRGSGGDCNVTNNMISLGNLQTTNTSFIGVGIFSGGGAPTLTRIYHNTINIMGVVTTGALPSFGIYRGNFSTSAVTFPVDIRNNLITNTRTGGTGAHCAIANNYGATTVSSSGWGANASNNNVLNGTASTIGWWTSAQTFAGWQTSSASDGASSSGITVTYIN